MAQVWTEESIERWVERRMDQLDAQLMSGKLTQAEYDHWTKDLNEFAERAYAELAAANYHAARFQQAEELYQ